MSSTTPTPLDIVNASPYITTTISNPSTSHHETSVSCQPMDGHWKPHLVFASFWALCQAAALYAQNYTDWLSAEEVELLIPPEAIDKASRGNNSPFPRSRYFSELAKKRKKGLTSRTHFHSSTQIHIAWDNNIIFFTAAHFLMFYLARPHPPETFYLRQTILRGLWLLFIAIPSHAFYEYGWRKLNTYLCFSISTFLSHVLFSENPSLLHAILKFLGPIAAFSFGLRWDCEDGFLTQFVDHLCWFREYLND